MWVFLSTLSLRRATVHVAQDPSPGRISIHALLAESDYPAASCRPRGGDFYPRSPCGERHPSAVSRPHVADFYPRSPCGERRGPLWYVVVSQLQFLSTLSLRRATGAGGERSEPPARFLSTLSLRRATVSKRSEPSCRRFLSTLSLRRATFCRCACDVVLRLFLPTLSLRRATTDGLFFLCAKKHFYPRSPCGERHQIEISTGITAGNFYPRSPCGERPRHNHETAEGHQFLSTLSLRRATARLIGVNTRSKNFYPRSPCGERPSSTVIVIFCIVFYPRSPCGERLRQSAVLCCLIIFLSTLSLRRATRGLSTETPCMSYFYPRSPCGERRH